MRSKSKHRLTDFEVKELVRINFGEDAEVLAVTELTGGMYNAAYIINLSPSCAAEPKNMVLKVAPKAGARVLTYEKDIMRAEVQLCSIYARSGIPVPRVIHSDFTHKHCESDYFFMEKLSGRTYFDMKKLLAPSVIDSLKEEIGAYMAKMHTIKGNYFGYIKSDESFHHEWWADAFEAFINDIIRDGKEAGVRLPYRRVLKTFEPNWKHLAEVHSPVLVNFDIWEKNIFVAEKDGKYEIEAFIDHERAFFGDPLAEFVASPTFLKQDITKETALLKGYESVTGKKFILNNRDRIRILMYRVYLDLIMAVETAFRYNGATRLSLSLFARFMLEKHLSELSDIKTIYDKD